MWVFSSRRQLLVVCVCLCVCVGVEEVGYECVGGKVIYMGGFNWVSERVN